MWLSGCKYLCASIKFSRWHNFPIRGLVLLDTVLGGNLSSTKFGASLKSPPNNIKAEGYLSFKLLTLRTIPSRRVLLFEELLNPSMLTIIKKLLSSRITDIIHLPIPEESVSIIFPWNPSVSKIATPPDFFMDLQNRNKAFHLFKSRSPPNIQRETREIRTKHSIGTQLGVNTTVINRYNKLSRITLLLRRYAEHKARIPNKVWEGQHNLSWTHK